MADHVYKKIEIVGSSPDSVEKAIENGIARAAKTIKNMRWFEVNEIRGQIDDQKIGHYQVGMKIGFTIEYKD